VTASDEGRLPSQDVDDVEDGYPLEAFGNLGSPHTLGNLRPAARTRADVEPEEEGLSLRERLARAGARRKRLS
jgi:hypothetical protein